MNDNYCQNNATPTPFRLWRYLDHTRYMIFRLREKELAQVGLTPEQAQVLDIIYSAGGSTTINSIVRATQRQHNSMSTLITRMTRQGLVKKNRTRRDRRAYRIAITEKGEAAYHKIPSDAVDIAFSCLPENNRQELLENLLQLLSHVYRVSGTEFDPNFLIQERESSSKSDT